MYSPAAFLTPTALPGEPLENPPPTRLRPRNARRHNRAALFMAALLPSNGPVHGTGHGFESAQRTGCARSLWAEDRPVATTMSTEVRAPASPVFPGPGPHPSSRVTHYRVSSTNLDTVWHAVLGV